MLNEGTALEYGGEPGEAQAGAGAAFEAPHIIGSRPGYALWITRGLYGMSVWGAHTRDDSEQFYRDVERQLAMLDGPCDHLSDTHRMRLGDHDWRSVRRGLGWARENRARLEACTRRWVGVVPNTAMGWVIVGSQRLLGVAYPSRAETSIDAALRWLGREDRAPLGAWIDTLPEVARARSAELGRLRELLVSAPELTLGQAARALGVGERSLQRVLANHGTSFRAEHARVRATLP